MLPGDNKWQGTFVSHFRRALVRRDLLDKFFIGEWRHYRDRSKNCELCCTVFLTLFLQHLFQVPSSSAAAAMPEHPAKFP